MRDRRVIDDRQERRIARYLTVYRERFGRLPFRVGEYRA